MTERLDLLARQAEERADSERDLVGRTLSDRIRRAQELPRHAIIPQGWITRGQIECRRLFIEGHAYGCILTCIAVVDGLTKYVAARNGEPMPRRRFRQRVGALKQRGWIDEATSKALHAVWGTARQRNTFMHFNEDLESDPDVLEERARECIFALHAVESSLFAFTPGAPGLRFRYPQLWPEGAEPGTTSVYVDFT